MAGLFKYKVLNFILLPVVLSTAFMNYETWSHSNGSGKDAAQRPEARLEKQSKTAALAVKEAPEPIQAFRIIAEKNIFNPERKDFPPPEAVPGGPKPIVRPPVILYGVTIADDYQSASVSSPGRPLRKGERDTMTLKLGSKIGEYKLAKIAADRITMEAGEDSFEVLLYDPRNPKKRIEVKTAIQSSEVKTTQPALPTPQTAGTAKAETIEKPAEPKQERAITAAPSIPGATSFRSAARKRMGVSTDQNTGVVKSSTGDRVTSPGLWKPGPK